MLERIFEMPLVAEVLEEVLQRPPSNTQAVTVRADIRDRVMRMTPGATRPGGGRQIDMMALVIRMAREARESIFESGQVLGGDEPEILV
jgi:hypothetical protein